ncbi:MAG: DegT/DnrJ/EryC1/StrS family aminotransferase [Phycisphaerae bacterium]|jgi:dTDP-4-amino-4,6-dideoxygalactose transaminase
MSATDLAAYQREFAEAVGAVQAFGFWKGRVALYAILKALGIGEGDEVVLPGYTCVMAVNPIVYLGAKPVFVDINPVTYNLDPDQIESHITPRTKLLIAQHTYGYPADMGAILDIAQRKGLPVVEDCCLSFGSRYAGKPTGTFGLAAYYSFQWNKPYTSGLGGMAAINDADLAGRVAALCERELTPPSGREVNMLRAQLAVYRTLVYPRTTAFAQTAFRLLTRAGLVVGSSGTCEFRPTMEPGFFKGMSAMQARVGRKQLRRRDRGQAHRRELAALYDRLLTERGWPVPRLPTELDPVLVRYPVRVADKEKAVATAARHFVEVGSWFECPLHPIETPMEAYGYHTGMCPEADRACRETVNLAVHPRASARTVRRSVEFITGIGPAPQPS